MNVGSPTGACKRHAGWKVIQLPQVKLIVSAVFSIGGAAVLTIQAHRLERTGAEYAKTIAQTAADAAALAGAASFLEVHDDAQRAKDNAIEYVRANNELHPEARLRAKDIQVDLKEGTITVAVEARLWSVPTALARLFGIRESMVTAEATAEAQAPWCVDTGQNAEGFQTMHCEGIVKTLKLIHEDPLDGSRR